MSDSFRSHKKISHSTKTRALNFHLGWEDSPSEAPGKTTQLRDPLGKGSNYRLETLSSSSSFLALLLLSTADDRRLCPFPTLTAWPQMHPAVPFPSLFFSLFFVWFFFCLLFVKVKRGSFFLFWIFFRGFWFVQISLSSQLFAAAAAVAFYKLPVNDIFTTRIDWLADWPPAPRKVREFVGVNATNKLLLPIFRLLMLDARCFMSHILALFPTLELQFWVGNAVLAVVFGPLSLTANDGKYWNFAA